MTLLFSIVGKVKKSWPVKQGPLNNDGPGVASIKND